jgi:hypothetical protein
VRQLLIDPLCVAALNTPADQASAQVFLRVLRDALFGGSRLGRPAAAASPAGRVAARAGRLAAGRRRHAAAEHACLRCASARPAGGRWRALRRRGAGLQRRRGRPAGADLAPAGRPQAGGLRYEPIVTVYLQADGVRLPRR